jgi:Domain of unknown function (DUF4389)
VATYSPYQPYPGSAPEDRGGPLPVLVAVADRASQRRLTVLVRLILLIPHAIVLYCLALAACVVAFLGWWAALFTGRLPQWVGEFLSGLLRWAARVFAYGLLLTDAYPPFTIDDVPTYPVRLAFPAPQRLNRAAVFFRIILVIPAWFVGAMIGFGAGTLMGFIAWLITLVAGRLPASYHQAFTAVVRYQMRYYAYWTMLTPTYPRGLFGDKPGVPTWADQPAAPTGITPPFEAVPGFGTAESVYGTAPGGYGAPAGYGGRPVFQPATWSLLLTSGAKKLVTTFIVLGAVLWIADVGLQVHNARHEVNAMVANIGRDELRSAHGTLNSQLTAWHNAVQACGNNLPCVTSADASAATDVSVFASRLQAIPLPASVASAGARLNADATTLAQDYTTLSTTTSVSEYQSTLTSTGLAGTLATFNADYSALAQELSSF